MQSSAQLLSQILNATIAGKREVMDAEIKKRSSLFNNHLELLKGGYSRDSINKALSDPNNPDYSALQKEPTEEELNVERLKKAVADGVTEFNPQVLSKYGVTQSAKDIISWYDKKAVNDRLAGSAEETGRHNKAMEKIAADRNKRLMNGGGGSTGENSNNLDIAALAAEHLGRVRAYKSNPPEKLDANDEPNPEYAAWPGKEAVFNSQINNLQQILSGAKQGKDVSSYYNTLPDTSGAKAALAPLFGNQIQPPPPSFDDMYDDLNDPEIPNTAKQNLINQFSAQDIDSLNEVAKRRGHPPLF